MISASLNALGLCICGRVCAPRIYKPTRVHCHSMKRDVLQRFERYLNAVGSKASKVVESRVVTARNAGMAIPFGTSGKCDTGDSLQVRVFKDGKYKVTCGEGEEEVEVMRGYFQFAYNEDSNVKVAGRAEAGEMFVTSSLFDPGSFDLQFSTDLEFRSLTLWSSPWNWEDQHPVFCYLPAELKKTHFVDILELTPTWDHVLRLFENLHTLPNSLDSYNRKEKAAIVGSLTGYTFGSLEVKGVFGKLLDQFRSAVSKTTPVSVYSHALIFRRAKKDYSLRMRVAGDGNVYFCLENETVVSTIEMLQSRLVEVLPVVSVGAGEMVRTLGANKLAIQLIVASYNQ